jgi:hypothetical protein
MAKVGLTSDTGRLDVTASSLTTNVYFGFASPTAVTRTSRTSKRIGLLGERKNCVILLYEC